MHVQHVGFHSPRLDDSKKRMYYRLKALFSRRVKVNQLHTLVFLAAVSFIHITAAAYHRHIMSHGRYARIQVLAMRLNPSRNVGNATGACHYYLHQPSIFVIRLL